MSRNTSPWLRGFSLRLRAVLAGGLVLGIGTTVTLASWNDSEYATGTFVTSVFNTESSVQGGGYADHSSSQAAAQVTFTGAGLSPGVSQYFPVLVRTKATSTAGTLTLNGAAVAGADAATLGNALTYRVVRSAATCAASAFTSSPTWVVGGATTYRSLTLGQEAAVTNALAAATTALPGTPTGFCFEVTLPAGADNSLQGKTATATWQLAATSN